ncbi:uncharacterized protein LOC132270254 [Cornus florida]|uniref:uncharacterized protein LOC132270254 n=1 Tax=Cornus florida TaxID=4283 RepID=UPI00289E1E08|nr:uncharacterized protein LOC132270254 [Cornus florida]
MVKGGGNGDGGKQWIVMKVSGSDSGGGGDDGGSDGERRRSKQGDAGPANAKGGENNPTVGFMPLHRNHSYSNLSPDSRWWLHLQPNYGYQRGLTNEKLLSLGAVVAWNAGGQLPDQLILKLRREEEEDAWGESVGSGGSLDLERKLDFRGERGGDGGFGGVIEGGGGGGVGDDGGVVGE